MRSLVRFSKSLARMFLHKAGGLRAVRYWNRKGFRILMYHDFPSVAGFKEALAAQCKYIQRHYTVVTMTEIARHLNEGVPLPPHALAITVDDGNRDFLLNGYPVFHEYHIPVTVFLVSGFLDRKLWLWWDQITYLLEKTRRPIFQMSLSPGAAPVVFILETPDQRRQAIFTITEAMKKLDEAVRIELLNRLPRLLDIELPNEAPPHMAPMEWSEVGELAKDGIDFGAHTVTHPVLSRIKNSEQLRDEIDHSKKRIEERLGRPVLHFCYPYGCEDDFNEATIKAVDQCGFQTAVTAIAGINNRRTPPFRLKRFGVEPLDPKMPEFYFHECLAGLHSR